VLVTGRVLSDLRWLLNGQDLFFDVIVAESLFLLVPLMRSRNSRIWAIYPGELGSI
jgi:hypothetical protein